MDIKMAKNKYAVHKAGAKVRNIEWLFTFEDWLQLWIDSGKWEQRGNKRGQYCMSRYGDKGPYSLNNVFIQLTSQNTSEAYKPRVRGKPNIKSKTLVANYKKYTSLTGASLYLKISKQLLVYRIDANWQGYYYTK
jgi:hypothetical protein